MPCRTNYPEPDYHKEEVDKLTRLLCLACNILEGLSEPVPDELIEWWRNHKSEDKNRLSKALKSQGFDLSDSGDRAALERLLRESSS